jgi:DNA-binding response OmpR family regulator
MISVLIVDRDAETRLVGRRVLEAAGFAVSATADDSNLPEGQPDLAIADLAEVSAATLIRRYPQTRVLALSSEDRTGLAKPFTSSQLLAAVRRRLARPIMS